MRTFDNLPRTTVAKLHRLSKANEKTGVTPPDLLAAEPKPPAPPAIPDNWADLLETAMPYLESGEELPDDLLNALDAAFSPLEAGFGYDPEDGALDPEYDEEADPEESEPDDDEDD